MFIIVVIIIFAAGGRGEVIGQDRFPTIEACETARGPMTEGLRRAIEAQHGPAEMKSRCMPIGAPA